MISDEVHAHGRPRESARPTRFGMTGAASAGLRGGSTLARAQNPQDRHRCSAARAKICLNRRDNLPRCGPGVTFTGTVLPVELI